MTKIQTALAQFSQQAQNIFNKDLLKNRYAQASATVAVVALATIALKSLVGKKSTAKDPVAEQFNQTFKTLSAEKQTKFTEAFKVIQNKFHPYYEANCLTLAHGGKVNTDYETTVSEQIERAYNGFVAMHTDIAKQIRKIEIKEDQIENATKHLNTTAIELVKNQLENLQDAGIEYDILDQNSDVVARYSFKPFESEETRLAIATKIVETYYEVTQETKDEDKIEMKISLKSQYLNEGILDSKSIAKAVHSRIEGDIDAAMRLFFLADKSTGFDQSMFRDAEVPFSLATRAFKAASKEVTGIAKPATKDQALAAIGYLKTYLPTIVEANVDVWKARDKNDLADDAINDLTQEQTVGQQEIQKLEEKVTKATKKADKKPEDQQLKEAKSALEKSLSEAKQKLATLEKDLEKAQEAKELTQKAVDAAVDAQVNVRKEIAELVIGEKEEKADDSGAMVKKPVTLEDAGKLDALFDAIDAAYKTGDSSKFPVMDGKVTNAAYAFLKYFIA